jgi:ribosomal protein S27E
MSTIDTTNNLILTKLKVMLDIAKVIDEPQIENKIEAILENYEMTSIKILSDYYMLTNLHNGELKETNKEEYVKKISGYYQLYQTFIQSENFVGKINRYFTILKRLFDQKADCNELRCGQVRKVNDLVITYESSTISQTISNIVYNRCEECNNEMTVFSNRSEIVCVKCGVTTKLYGTVFEDEQFYYQEGQRTKHVSYDPSKHCRFWIERIQGRESKEIPASVIDAVKKCIKYNNIRNREDITCKEIRKYLSQTKNSKYNEHVPLIRKLITGEPLHQLTDKEVQLITIYFDKVIRVYDEIKPNKKSNVLYHPFLIYKLIEHIIATKPRAELRTSKDRLYHILSYIHLQSRETLIENDKIWKRICEKIPEIHFTPTDRNDQL